MIRATLLAAMIASTLTSLPAHAQSAGSNQAAQMQAQVCQMYQNNLVQALQAAEAGLSDEALRADNLPPVSQAERQSTLRSILEGLIEAEQDRTSRQIITNAANRYLRSGNINTFAQGLDGLAEACMNTNQSRQAPDTATQEPSQQAPAPGSGNQWRYRNNKPDNNSDAPSGQNNRESRLPSRDSYL